MGRIYEKKALIYLTSIGISVFQADWIGKWNDKWTFFEAKGKNSIFENDIIRGHGMDIKQIAPRLQFEKETGIRCYMMWFWDGYIYMNYLSELEKGFYFDTKNEIRIANGDEEATDLKADTTLLAVTLGVGGTQALTSILADPNLTISQKQGTLKVLFGLSDEQTNQMLTL